MAGSDFPAIEIYYYSIAGMEKREITPIRLHRKYKKNGGFYWGEGGVELSKQIIDMSARVCTEAQAQ